MSGAPLMRLRGLGCRRGTRTLFTGVDLDIRAGERIALLGPNGAGKTSLLHAMVGLMPITSGHIEAFGNDTRTEDDFMAGARLLVELRDRLGRILQIAVHHHRVLAGALGEPGGDRRVLTEVAAEPHAAHPDRELPPVYTLQFRGGELVELTKDQRYADQVVIRAGERGKTLHPSSQAASWVVLFPRISSSKPYVVPEWLLSRV